MHLVQPTPEKNWEDKVHHELLTARGRYETYPVVVPLNKQIKDFSEIRIPGLRAEHIIDDGNTVTGTLDLGKLKAAAEHPLVARLEPDSWANGSHGC